MPTADVQPDSARILGDVAAAFGLGRVLDVQVLTAGTMNRSWRVHAAGGTAAVKEVLDVDAVAARRQAVVCQALADRGLPVPTPLLTAAGDHLVERAGVVYTAARWVTGVSRAGAELTMAEAAGLGTLLADVHDALGAVLPTAPPMVVEPVCEVAAADEQLARYGALAAAAGGDAMDTFVVAEVPRRRRLLNGVADRRPVSGVLCGPAGWIHGDYQHNNLVWQAGAVAGVLDWDRLRVRPVAAELVRAAMLIFAAEPGPGLDLPRVGAFVCGYRARRVLPDAAIEDAADRLWWDRVCETWHLRLRYERGDTSCDGFFRSASGLLEWWTQRRDEVLEALLGSVAQVEPEILEC
ncbi:phosphotransferase [Dactylosporangium sp. NPDC050688]|uniref:phosphotransferase n=1 Tax=Dactylosporangium sp. NPDC050688 TaxID=3157217 RepID=UPI0033CDF003